MKRNLITIKEASEKYKIDDKKIYGWLRDGEFDKYGTQIDENQFNDFVNGKPVNKHISSAFGDIILDWDESLKPLEAFHNTNALRNPGKYSSQSHYFISNKGRIFNFKNGKGKELSLNKAAHGYNQVDIWLRAGRKSERVHFLVAFVWCQNAKQKSEVHHINGNINDNRQENLIWVSPAEHDELHYLMKNKDKTRYKKRIKEIKNDNKWDDEYRVILFEKDNGIIYSWIKKEAYNDFISGKRELDDIYYYESLLRGERFIRFE